LFVKSPQEKRLTTASTADARHATLLGMNVNIAAHSPENNLQNRLFEKRTHQYAVSSLCVAFHVNLSVNLSTKRT
jgi:hypothetical protein